MAPQGWGPEPAALPGVGSCADVSPLRQRHTSWRLLLTLGKHPFSAASFSKASSPSSSFLFIEHLLCRGDGPPASWQPQESEHCYYPILPIRKLRLRVLEPLAHGHLLTSGRARIPALPPSQPQSSWQVPSSEPAALPTSSPLAPRMIL